jgi:hypothetical protein
MQARKGGWSGKGMVVACLVVAGLVSCVRAQMPTTMKVGAIDFFGAQGMDTGRVLLKLPIHHGQVLSTATMGQTLDGIRAAGFAVTGLKVTDVDVVCCDAPETVDFYVGLAGRSYRPLAAEVMPKGDARLSAEATALYQQDQDALMEAVQRGSAEEDDAKGYALTRYPAAQRVQLAMRVYAVAHEEEIESVLNAAKEAEQRRAAAMLLGYAERSARQVTALVEAANDVDGEVRNNAIRALEVLEAAAPLQGMKMEPLIALLYSGTWSDRNKVSLLLSRMTERRDAAMLEALRREAMGPLLDGARWHSTGHASPFLVILGRIGGIDEVRLVKMVEAGQRDEIIAAAEKRQG